MVKCEIKNNVDNKYEDLEHLLAQNLGERSKEVFDIGKRPKVNQPTLNINLNGKGNIIRVFPVQSQYQTLPLCPEVSDELRGTLTGLRHDGKSRATNSSLNRSTRSGRSKKMQNSGSKASYLNTFKTYVQPPMRFTSTNPSDSGSKKYMMQLQSSNGKFKTFS